MVIAQNVAAAEVQMKNPSQHGSGGYPGEMNGYTDEQKSGGGFANGDTKKRRGVSIDSPFSATSVLIISACGSARSLPQLQSSRNSGMAERT